MLGWGQLLISVCRTTYKSLGFQRWVLNSDSYESSLSTLPSKAQWSKDWVVHLSALLCSGLQVMCTSCCNSILFDFSACYSISVSNHIFNMPFFLLKCNQFKEEKVSNRRSPLGRFVASDTRVQVPRGAADRRCHSAAVLASPAGSITVCL